MKQFSCLLITLLALVAVLAACGGDSDNDGSESLKQYFPVGLADQGLRKVSEVRTFVGDSLWEYINGGAELYHSFGFVKVSTADYKNPVTELVLDLYEFETSDGAYGLYAGLRPDEPEIINLGVEGYFTGSSLEFVKGNVMARLVSYDASEATASALKGLAGKMAAVLPGTTGKPSLFGLIPEHRSIAYTDRITGEAFLGLAFLNMVYRRDYQLGTDTVTLFVLEDTLGDSMARWFEYISEEERSPVALADLPFDDDYYLLATNSYYGDILAGLINGKLVGVVNFSDQHMQFVSDWLSLLPETP